MTGQQTEKGLKQAWYTQKREDILYRKQVVQGHITQQCSESRSQTQSQIRNSVIRIHLNQGWQKGFSSNAYLTAVTRHRRAMLKVAGGPHSSLVRVYWGPLETSTPLLTGAGEHPTFYLHTPCFRDHSFSRLFLPPGVITLQWHGSNVLPMSCSLEKLKCMHMCILFPSFLSPSDGTKAASQSMY